MLEEGEFLIGRGKDCKLRPNSELVSRHHCCITLDDTGVRVREMGSTNGTFLNGRRITEETRVTNGDLVTVGPLTFAVIVVGPRPVGQVEPEADAAAPTIGAEDIASDEQLADWLSHEEQKVPADAGSQEMAGRTMVIDKTQLPDEDLTMAQNGEDDEDTAQKRAKQKTQVIPTDETRSTADAAGDLMRKYFQRQSR